MGIKKSKTGRREVYSQSFKSGVCMDVLSGKFSYSEARIVHGIPGMGTIRRWVKQYQEQSNLHRMDTPNNESPNTGQNSQPESKEDPQQRTRELEEALKLARLKITALETMIDIAESELNIEIRKKSGTKQ